MLSEYEYLATKRSKSLFMEDMIANYALLNERLSGSRVAIIGAAGSVGFSLVKAILHFHLQKLVLIDISENNLVEAVRDIRSSADIIVPEDFTALPIGMGSVECDIFFRDNGPFDYIFNLSAIKHVRSEKDTYSIKRMINTNVLYLNSLLETLQYRVKKFFSVSSDKATNPANVMGATKMIMEKVLLASQRHPFSTARFANVAFSDGSLPYGFLNRIEKRQPLSAPRDIKRFFISHEEAGHICLLSCILGENRDIFFPHLIENLDEYTFSDIAVQLLEKLGYTPFECDSEESAKQNISTLIAQKKWPCYFFKSDTSGEKAYEEFYAADEVIDWNTFRNIGIIKQSPASHDAVALSHFIQFATDAQSDPSVTKEDYIREIRQIVPSFAHQERGKNLDQKM